MTLQPRSQDAKADKRVGLFGGSFDPPHAAHQLVCTLALSLAQLDEVWLAPCHRHAFDKELSSFDHRLAMCELAAAPFGGRVRVSAVEQELGGVSRTVATLEHLGARYPDLRWVLVVGSDILAEAPKWLAWDRIESLAELFVVPRGDTRPQEGVGLPDISSSDIRSRVRRGADVSGLLPGAVLNYVSRHGLYAAPSDP